MQKIRWFNDWLASKITGAVGTMLCAYIFTILALLSLPSVLSTGNVIQIVSWITQTFLQLVLLSILMVGQNLAGKASEDRATETHQIVKESHRQQMQELDEMKQLLKEAEQERKEMKHLLDETREILHTLHKERREQD